MLQQLHRVKVAIAAAGGDDDEAVTE